MVEINNKTKSKINSGVIKRVAKQFLKANKIENNNLSIAFIGDAAMRKLNKTYRGKDKPTDILSFPGEDGYLGEIIINYAQIKRQAGVYKNSVRQELIFILVHGLLHLLGYNDETEKGRREMEILAEKFIRTYQKV